MKRAVRFKTNTHEDLCACAPIPHLEVCLAGAIYDAVHSLTDSQVRASENDFKAGPRSSPEVRLCVQDLNQG